MTGWLLVACSLIATALLAVGPHLAGYRTLTVWTASMRPSMPPGSIAVVVPTAVEHIAVGDVISFTAPGGARTTHRIVASVAPGVAPVVQTQGDANAAPDRELVTLPPTVWRVRAVVPWLGFVVAAVHDAGLAEPAVRFGPWLAVLPILVGLWRPRRGRAVPPATDATLPGPPVPAIGPMGAARLAGAAALVAGAAIARRRATTGALRLVR